jgi:ferredoxin-NADP reductase/MOSC domain-containing protein YiiM
MTMTQDMRLVGIAVGKTRSVDIRGATMQTAYIKTPVSGKCHVNEAGVEGNETAVHPDAIYAIAAEHYSYWAERLGADPATWLPGHFAENLTIQGLDETKLHVGDIVAVGSEVELIVAGPRIPCFKLSWRMAQPDSFIREFGISRRSGVYFGVHKTGWIEPGMPVRIIHREPDHSTVTEVASLALECPTPPAATVRALLELPYLSRSAALVLDSLLMKVLDTQQQTEGWKDWREFTITDVRDECTTVKSLTLKPSDCAALPRSRAGQFVTVNIPDMAVARPWSLSDYDEAAEQLRITVKREPGGVGSAWIHDRARPGGRLSLRAPAGRFVLDRGVFMPVVLIGAGIGITPLLAMAKAHLARGDRAPPLRLIHCVPGEDCHPLREELNALAAAHPTLRVLYVYSRSNSRLEDSNLTIRTGRLTADQVVGFLEDLAITLGNKRVSVPWFEADFYICGPDSFERTLQSGLVERGARAHRIFSERFHAGGELPPVTEIEEAEVVFARSGRSARWSRSHAVTLLELAEQVGLAPSYGCRIGACQSCHCAILEGEARYDSRPIAEIPKGAALLCCAKPATPRIVLSL